MRCFLAVELDDTVKSKIIALQEQIMGFDVKLVEPQNLHFTLKFLGNVDNTPLKR